MSLRELVEQATPPQRITDDETEAAVERAAARLYPLAPELAALCADMADEIVRVQKGYGESINGHFRQKKLLARYRELEGRTGKGTP